MSNKIKVSEEALQFACLAADGWNQERIAGEFQLVINKRDSELGALQKTCDIANRAIEELEACNDLLKAERQMYEKARDEREQLRAQNEP